MEELCRKSIAIFSLSIQSKYNVLVLAESSFELEVNKNIPEADIITTMRDMMVHVKRILTLVGKQVFFRRPLWLFLETSARGPLIVTNEASTSNFRSRAVRTAQTCLQLFQLWSTRRYFLMKLWSIW